MGTPHYPPDPAGERNRVRDLINDVFTAARTRVAYGFLRAAKLIVGAADFGSRIEVDPTGSHPEIRMISTSGELFTLAGVDNTAILEAQGEEAGFDSLGQVEVGPHLVEMHINATDGGSELAEVRTTVGSDPRRANITLQTTGGTPAESNITLDTQGSVVVSADRGVDFIGLGVHPATPSASLRLYALGGRLYYKNNAGTVFGPL